MDQEIRILKSAGLLQHFVAGRLQHEYSAEVGRHALDKVQEGDEATPLGEFFVCAKNPLSRFHRSLCLSYPNRAHAERGLQQRLINREEFDTIVQTLEAGRMPPQKTRLGGEIYVHGRSQGPAGTRGCIAVDNAVVEMLFDTVPLGTRVTILP